MAAPTLAQTAEPTGAVSTRRCVCRGAPRATPASTARANRASSAQANLRRASTWRVPARLVPPPIPKRCGASCSPTPPAKKEPSAPQPTLGSDFAKACMGPMVGAIGPPTSASDSKRMVVRMACSATRTITAKASGTPAPRATRGGNAPVTPVPPSVTRAPATSPAARGLRARASARVTMTPSARTVAASRWSASTFSVDGGLPLPSP